LRKVHSTLTALAVSINATPEHQLEQPVVQLKQLGTTGLDDECELGEERRQRMSAALSALAAAADKVSDRLALRHFSLVGTDVHTVAL